MTGPMTPPQDPWTSLGEVWRSQVRAPPALLRRSRRLSGLELAIPFLLLLLAGIAVFEHPDVVGLLTGVVLVAQSGGLVLIWWWGRHATRRFPAAPTQIFLDAWRAGSRRQLAAIRVVLAVIVVEGALIIQQVAAARVIRAEVWWVVAFLGLLATGGVVLSARTRVLAALDRIARASGEFGGSA